jgi:hypothetical protein
MTEQSSFAPPWTDAPPLIEAARVMPLAAAARLLDRPMHEDDRLLARLTDNNRMMRPMRLNVLPRPRGELACFLAELAGHD